MIEDMIRLEVTKRGGKTARPGAIALAIAVIRGDEHVRRLTYPSQRQLYGLDPHDYSFKRDWIDDKECGRIRWMINVYYAADAASRATLRFPNPSAARQRAEKKKRAPSHSELLLPRLLPAAAPLPPPYCRSVSHDAGPSDTEREHSTPKPAGPSDRADAAADAANTDERRVRVVGYARLCSAVICLPSVVYRDLCCESVCVHCVYVRLVLHTPAQFVVCPLNTKPHALVPFRTNNNVQQSVYNSPVTYADHT